MAIKIGEKKRHDPIIKNLTIPVSQTMLDEYKAFQKQLDDLKEEKSMHDWARERLASLLSDLRAALNPAA